MIHIDKQDKQKYNILGVTEQKGTQSEESEVLCSAS